MGITVEETKFNKALDIIEYYINGFNLSNCLKMHVGKNTITIHSYVLDEIFTFEYVQDNDELYLSLGSIYAKVIDLEQLHRVILKYLFYPSSGENKCSKCKLGCR